MNALGVVDGDVNPRHAKDITDVADGSIRPHVSYRDGSPTRERLCGDQNSSGGLKDPSPPELDYQNEISQCNALFANKDLEIQCLMCRLERKKSERRRTDSGS